MSNMFEAQYRFFRSWRISFPHSILPLAGYDDTFSRGPRVLAAGAGTDATQGRSQGPEVSRTGTGRYESLKKALQIWFSCT